ncbi:MAG TPA: COX15/CtaA family protein, partial [Ktedonobacteraceae bacterium]
MKLIRSTAWAATAVTYFLIALGGTVLATNSGLSCPDWPFCYGQAYYAGTYHVFLEQFHRFTAATVSILIVLLLIGVITWARPHKDHRTLFSLAIAAPILLAIQIVLGGLTVLWKLPPQIITAHLGTALAIFALLITIAVLSSKPVTSKEHPAKTRKFAQLAISNALLVYILMLFGSYVTGSGAALACPGWPLCTPASWAVNNHLADINILHRTFAVFVGLVMLWTVISALRRWHVARGQAIVALVVGILFVYQAIVGGLIVLLHEPAFVAGLHLALAAAVWGTLVLLAALAANQLRAAPAPQEIERMEMAEEEAKKEVGIVRQTIANYVDLMKPHVTVLLLGVTVAAMAIANQGLPP